MRIFVDARCVRPGRTGVGLATEAWLRALAENYPEDQLTALVLLRTPTEGLHCPNLHLRATRMDYEWHPLAELYSHWMLPRLAARTRAQVFWGPAFAIPSTSTPFPRIVTVHDLSVFDHPSDYSPSFGAYLRWRIRRAVHAADGIHCVSNDARRRITARWPEAAAKCRVIPCGVDEFFFAESPVAAPLPPLPKFFILTVGGGQPRKNAQFGAEIVRILRDEFRLPCDYVVVGHDAKLPTWVHQYPLRAKRELVAFYKRAALLLMPSTDEGFGIPALEAMAAGCPVAVSNRGALPEVVGDAAVHIFALEDGPANVAARLAAILQNKVLIEAKREVGRKRAHEFTWRSSAIGLRQFFEDLVQKKEATRG